MTSEPRIAVPGTTLPGDTIVRQRQRRQLLSPSGRAVMRALAENRSVPLTASALAELAQVSSTAARSQAYRAAQLGYATQTTLSFRRARAAMAWQITPAGREFTTSRIGLLP